MTTPLRIQIPMLVTRKQSLSMIRTWVMMSWYLLTSLVFMSLLALELTILALLNQTTSSGHLTMMAVTVAPTNASLDNKSLTLEESKSPSATMVSNSRGPPCVSLVCVQRLTTSVISTTSKIPLDSVSQLRILRLTRTSSRSIRLRTATL